MDSEKVDDEKDFEGLPKEGPCANCRKTATLRCSNCLHVFYCKATCQQLHWNTHKSVCKPVKFVEDKVRGRCLETARSFKAGEEIFHEDPLVVGPKQFVEPLCLSCYKKVDGKYRCPKCTWPVCNIVCSRGPDHRAECSLGQAMGSPIDIADFTKPNHFYEVIMPFRCLALKKKKNPEKYKQLMNLQSHYESRKNTATHTENQKTVVNMLRNYFMLLNYPTDEIDCSEINIHKVTGIIDVNAVDIRGLGNPEGNVHGLYYVYSMMEHSCVPNVACTFDGKRIIVTAGCDMPRGTRLTTCYTDILWGTLARRDTLKLTKYFMCTCPRCSDPTELKTDFSSLRCQVCPMGTLVPASPLDEKASWICNKCNITLDKQQIRQTTLDLGEQIEKALESPSIRSLELTLDNLISTMVGPSHFHVFYLRQTLIDLYMQENKYTEEVCSKLMSLCKTQMKLCLTLDPSVSQVAPHLFKICCGIYMCMANDKSGNSKVEGTELQNLHDTLKKCAHRLRLEMATPDDPMSLIQEGQKKLSKS